MLGFKLQAAVDFLMSYGVALIIIIIAVAVIYKVGVLNPVAAPVMCTPSPGFSCGIFAINSSGALTIYISQATGGPIVVHGVACSSAVNGSGNGPAYGNIYVTANPAYYPYNSYPPNALQNGIVIYSGTGNTLYANCYNSAGIASGRLGNAFIGYLWLNYSMPGYQSTIQKVASVSLKYT
ncbi:MAG: hypothetical protein ACP5JN_00670 [Candidatus Micrarchaeia archaeon]|jgi:hypothetical protein